MKHHLGGIFLFLFSLVRVGHWFRKRNMVHINKEKSFVLQ